MIRIAIGFMWMIAAASPAGAVKPGLWSHSTEADFAAGKLDKTVLTSLGEVMLARAVETLLPPAEKLGMISAVAVDGRGRVFVATAPGGTVHRVVKGKLVKFAELPGPLVRYLGFRKGVLIAGASGDKAGLYRIDAKGKVAAIWTDKKVTGVWAVAGAKDGWYVGTGAEGKVYHVRDNGKARVVYDSDEKNILSLASAAGLLYAGTGEKGLIVEIDPARKKFRVLYDAAEGEIAAIVVAPDGVVYAATSDSAKAGASGQKPSGQVKGRPAKAPTPGAHSKPASKPAGKAAPPAPGGPAKAPASPPPAVRPPARPAPPTGTPVKPGNGPPAAARAQAASMPAEPADESGIAVFGLGPSTSPAKPAGTPPGAGPRDLAKILRSSTGPSPPVRPGQPGRPSSATGKGNAVYRIDRDGFVRAVFRRPVTIWAMALRKDVLVLATGHGGEVFTVDLIGDRTSMVVKLDPKDITAMAADAAGKVYLGTSDKAAVYALSAGLARKGTLVSKALDAGQIASWGSADVRADVPSWCSAKIAVRSGNVAEPDDKTWSAWSRESDASKGWTKLTAPAGRFLQYRLSLAGNGKKTPAVDQVQLVYQVRNLAPTVRAVQVVPSGDPKQRGGKGPGPKPFRMIQIQAADPNGDPLRYAIHFRRVGRKLWIKLADKHTQPKYAWDTTGVPDGLYEVRTVVSDAPGNPPGAALSAARISRPVPVDNTPPTVRGLKAKAARGLKATFSGVATDAAARIVRIEYAVDTNDEWVPVAPADGICDSRKEAFSVEIADLEPGPHRLAVRVTDEFSNVGYAAVEVTIGP